MTKDYSFITNLAENFTKELREQKSYDDIDVYVFPQTWGSTALGYGGIGGSMMTSASTVVLYANCENIVRVYFGCGLLAYEIKNPNRLFFEDMFNHRVAEKFKSGKYRREEI